MEVRAPQKGVITALLAKEGDTVEVGQPAFKMNPSGASSAEAAANEDASTTRVEPATESVAAPDAPVETASDAVTSTGAESMDILVPEMGESIKEGTVQVWEKKVGDSFKEDEVIVMLETDKIMVDVRAPKAGVLQAQLAKEGDTVAVGSKIASFSFLQEGQSPGAISAFFGGWGFF